MCGLSYTQQAKLIALVEIVTSMIGCFFVSISTLILGFSPEIRNEILHEDSENILNIILHFSMPEKVTSVVIPILYFIGEFILAVFLYKSVVDVSYYAYKYEIPKSPQLRNYKRIRVWYIVTVTICMVAVYFFLPGVFFTDDSLYFIGIFIASYAFTAYSVWVVHSLMQEMKRHGLHTPIYTCEEDCLEKL